MNVPTSPQEVVDRAQTVLSHAWMVRTFVKHSEEVEDFPELMTIARTVFDTCRALQTRSDNPSAYLKMLRKKIGKLRNAAEKFREDTAQASTHMNFQQAVLSMDACVADLTALLQFGEALQTKTSLSGSESPLST